MAVFDWIPFFEGKYLNYGQYFALLMTIVLLITSLCFFFLWFIFSRITKFLTKREISKIAPNEGINWPLLLSHENSVNKDNPLAKDIFKEDEQRRDIPSSVKKQKIAKDSSYFKRSLLNFVRINKICLLSHKIYYILAICAIIFFGIFIPFFFENICVTIYNDRIGIPVPYEGADISTKMIRCPEGPPCYIYATVPEDTASAVFITAHTNIKENDVIFAIDTSDYFEKNKKFRINQKPLKIVPDLESKGERNVFSVLFNGLQANTSYKVGVYYGNFLQATRDYMTLPDKLEGNEEFLFASGGDLSSSDKAREMTRQVAEYRPRILFLGGDIAYDDGLRFCYHTWDRFLKMMETINEKAGFLIPMVLAVGNHDVGVNNLPKVNVEFDEKSPLYLQFFPQHYKTDATGKILPGVPALNERKVYFYQKTANFVYISLDSGYIEDFNGTQKTWMESIFKANIKKAKFAMYHVPTYSSCYYPDKDKKHFIEQMLYWSTVFDKYKLLTAFENHAHLFKVTRRLKGNQIAEDGTLYLGDGCWGPILNTCKMSSDPEIYEIVDRKHNVWISKITNKTVEHKAIGLRGEILNVQKQDLALYINN